MSARGWLCAGLSLAAGCRSQVAEAGPQACAPSSATLPADASAEALAGSYRLQLVASTGPSAGESAAGGLELRPYEAASRYRSSLAGHDTMTVYPSHGTTDVKVESVGAVASDLGSTDPSRPGVLVIGMRPKSDSVGARVMLRLGADANREGMTRFDGGYAVLRVRQITEDGFAGDWESGAPMPQAGGHFCAVRTEGMAD